MGRLFVLPPLISRETAVYAAYLHQQALTGNALGLVVGILRPERKYLVHVVGHALRDPVWARGIVPAIDDELYDLIEGIKPNPLV